MTRKILIVLAAFTLLLGVPLTIASATNPYTSVDGDCFGWTVINKTGDDLTVVHTNDADVPVGANVPANSATFFASLYTGDNGSLAITLEFADGRRVDEGASRDPVCDPTTTTTSSTSTSTTGGPPSSTTTTSTTSTTTTTPGTTTTSSTTSTTSPPGTTTTTTVTTTTHPGTTTSAVPTTTTVSPPSSTTAAPPTTVTTSAPPITPTIDVTVICDQIDTSGTGAREPIVTHWSGNYEVGDTSHTVWIVVYDGDGETIGTLEMVGLPSKGQHENWFIGKGIDGRTITAEVWLDGVLVDSHTAVCSVPTTVTVVTDPPPVTEPTLPVTGGDLGDFGIGGLGIVAAGVGMILWASKEPEGSNG